jgi:hypothetical protein
MGQELIRSFPCIDHTARQEVVDAAIPVHGSNLLREGGEVFIAEALRPVHRERAACTVLRDPPSPIAQGGVKQGRLIDVRAVHIVGRSVLGKEEVVSAPSASVRYEVAQVLEAGARRHARGKPTQILRASCKTARSRGKFHIENHAFNASEDAADPNLE